MEQITIRLDSDTLQAVDEEAETEGVSRSEYLRSVIESRSELQELEAEVRQLEESYADEVSDLRMWVRDLEETISRLESEKSTLVLDRGRYQARALRRGIPIQAGEDAEASRERELSKV